MRNFRNTERRKRRSRSFLPQNPFRYFRLHPLFLLVGVWYAITGELFLFFMSALVAIQHECAHAFASAKLGYKLHKIVLMPFGAIIDADLQGISFKDEIFVALCGPLCNLCTALFFGAIWWFAPTMYAFTDTAFYSSISIALVNLLPAYPLDGGRVLRCALTRALLKKYSQADKAEKIADRICRIISLLFSLAMLGSFVLQIMHGIPNITLLAFGLFLCVGAIGNRDKLAVYRKIDFSLHRPMQNGVEIRRVAVLDSCSLKTALRFITKGSYLVLEVYDEAENRLFNLTQNELARLLLLAKTPYQSLRDVYNQAKNGQKADISPF